MAGGMAGKWRDMDYRSAIAHNSGKSLMRLVKFTFGRKF
jgi:hypothetical protein